MKKHMPLSYRLFPFLQWKKEYSATVFRLDLLSGLTVGVVLIPQAMAYAMLAGLPPIYGLYAAAVTPAIGALRGSLRQLATGPIAIMSLLVLTTLAPLAEPGSPDFIKLAFLLSFIVGTMYLIIGLFRSGVIMAFISQSAVKGFTSAAALIITATQLPHFLGIKVVRHEYIFPSLLEIIKGLPGIHLLTLIIGLITTGLILGFKKFMPKVPGGLIGLVIATLMVFLLSLHESGVAIVGQTQGGLPSFLLPPFNFDIISSLMGPALVIALVSFAETYSVGKEISSQTHQKLNVNQEFIGQGLANMIGSFFQCYPVSGSFSRTAINFSTGARTGISSVVSSLSVILALLFLTPLLQYIPKAALAALVITAVMTLFNPGQVLKLWKMNRHDGIVAITVFALALLTKPDYALLIGVMMSLMFFLWKTMHPRIVQMTKDPELNTFLNADSYNKPSCPQILHLRIDNAIYFANAEYTMEKILERMDQCGTPLKFMALDFQTVGFIDITGVYELRELHTAVKECGLRLAMLAVHLPVKQVLGKAGMLDELVPGDLMENRNKAFGHLFSQIDNEYCRNTCPYKLFYECPEK
jgi:SulP family sulfate permease